MKNSNLDTLSQRIEQAVQEHIASCREVALAAVKRAFLDIQNPKASVALKATTQGPKTRLAAQNRGRRPVAEMQSLCEQLFQAVQQKPGETMTMLAGELGSTAAALSRPMALLKAAGKVRSIGQRQFTRYFPLGEESRAAA